MCKEREITEGVFSFDPLSAALKTTADLGDVAPRVHPSMSTVDHLLMAGQHDMSRRSGHHRLNLHGGRAADSSTGVVWRCHNANKEKKNLWEMFKGLPRISRRSGSMPSVPNKMERSWHFNLIWRCEVCILAMKTQYQKWSYSLFDCCSASIKRENKVLGQSGMNYLSQCINNILWP